MPVVSAMDLDRVRDLFSGFDALDAIDIGIVTAGCYLMLRLVSGTRAMTQLRGLAGAALAVLVVGWVLDLHLVKFLAVRGFPALLVAGAIVFQPELRRALDRLGRTGLRGWADRDSQVEVIDSVVTAAQRMAVVRHGGLFVFERGTGLQDVIDSGVPVDARISPELLEGIFFPNSPLHDMAVVLREARVVAAGCVLPLADTLPEGVQGLGTRHRAALGVTEHTDAFTVVVSEETGDISLAFGGRLIGVPDERRLRAMLEALLDAPAARSRNGGPPV